MALFQCSACGCLDLTTNTHDFALFAHNFDWRYAPWRKGKLLCHGCAPHSRVDGNKTSFGKWRGAAKVILPFGEFATDLEGRIFRVSKPSEIVSLDDIRIPFPDHVTVGSPWKHRNGLAYLIQGIANEKADKERALEYPVTVFYAGANGNLWAKPIDNFLSSMVPLAVER